MPGIFTIHDIGTPTYLMASAKHQNKWKEKERREKEVTISNGTIVRGPPALYVRNQRIIRDYFGGFDPYSPYRENWDWTVYLSITILALMAITMITLVILHSYGIVDLDPRMPLVTDHVINLIKQ